MLVDLTERVIKLVDGRDAIGFNFKFNLGAGGLIHIAGENTPMAVSNDDGDAATIFKMSSDDLSSMLSGELNAMNAYMSGKLIVEGDIAKAMTLGTFFS